MAIQDDVRLVFLEDGSADIAARADEAPTVEGLDTLVQALTMRLLVGRGELAGLGHPRYGSRIHELVGETLDRTSLSLLRRLVRAALKEDPRVTEVTRLLVRERAGAPGVVEIEAAVTAVTGEAVDLSLSLSLG